MANLSLSGLTLLGDSIAGIGTAVVVKELKLCFDLGILRPEVLSSNVVFISHGHTDHVGEIFNYLAVRALEHRNAASLLVPAGIGEPLRRTLQTWQDLAGSRFDYQVFELHPGAAVPLKAGITVTPFEVDHSIQTFGFLVEETVTKLKRQYVSLPTEEIARARSAGDRDMFFADVRPLFAYVPDTLPSGLDRLPDSAWNARILMVESSFLDDRKPLRKIRLGNHVRLDDITARLDRFHGQHVVLFHFSRIYRVDEIEGIVRSQLPEQWLDRVHCFLPSMDFPD